MARSPRPASVVDVPAHAPLGWPRIDYRTLPPPHRHLAVLLRSDLQEHLLAAAETRGIRVQVGRSCTGVSVTRDGAVLHFAAGADHGCDVVVAADGVHSVVRTSVGLPARLRALGWAGLRGTADLACTASVSRELWGADGRRFGIAPLPGGRTYFYCSAPAGRWAAVLDGGLKEWIRSWGAFGPDVAAVLDAVPDWRAVNYDEIHEVRARRWYRSPVFLVGDAAHAMAPNWGQGANCAMVDALVLVRLLAARAGWTTSGGGMNRCADGSSASCRPGRGWRSRCRA